MLRSLFSWDGRTNLLLQNFDLLIRYHYSLFILTMSQKIWCFFWCSIFHKEFSLQNILHYFCYVLRAFNTEKALRYEVLNCPLSFQDHEIFLIRIIKKGLKQANANIKDYSGYNSYENLCRISPVFGFGFPCFLWREGEIWNEGLKMH